MLTMFHRQTKFVSGLEDWPGVHLGDCRDKVLAKRTTITQLVSKLFLLSNRG